MNPIVIYYLLIINLLTFVSFGWDKRKSKKGLWRTSEKRLLTLALIGGSIGALTGMRVFHHKTLHKKFKYGIPAILLIHISLIFAYYQYL